jgi:hypothetical protein
MPYTGIKLTPYLLKSIIKSYFTLHQNLPKHQVQFFRKRIYQCKNTAFGREHNFSSIDSIEAFQKQVPIAHYEDMWPRIEKAMQWKRNILTPGKIEWFATSSWTTGASKYIPVTERSLKTNHFKAGTMGIMLYGRANPLTSIFMGQNLVIGGSFGINPYTGKKNIWFISAILQKNSPLRTKIMKQPKTNISYLLDREKKVEKIITSSIKKNITSLSGQPSRCSEFLLKVLQKTGKKDILEVRPHFQLLMRGGMGIDLYKETFAKLLPSTAIQYYQIYNASEWFFAMQHENNRDDMLLFLNHGVFYEFIPVDAYRKWDYAAAYTIDNVALWQEYVILVTTNAGLRRYVLGDTVIFTWLAPHTIKITWRTKYYIDLVGECMPLAPIESAIQSTCKAYGVDCSQFTVGPYIEPSGKKCYEVMLGCKAPPADKNWFIGTLDKALCEFWAYKDERLDTWVLSQPIVDFVDPDVFYTWLERKGKLWWQHKIPKVSNNRKILDELLDIQHSIIKD